MSENRLFLSGEENKYSSAVKRGPHDRFNSKIHRAQFFFYIICYFGFIFTRAYNSFLFCYIRHNVEPCCHAHDSQSCIVRDGTWSVSHCRLSRVSLGGSIPAWAYLQSRPQVRYTTKLKQLLVVKPDIC